MLAAYRNITSSLDLIFPPLSSLHKVIQWFSNLFFRKSFLSHSFLPRISNMWRSFSRITFIKECSVWGGRWSPACLNFHSPPVAAVAPRNSGGTLWEQQKPLSWLCSLFFVQACASLLNLKNNELDLQRPFLWTADLTMHTSTQNKWKIQA